MSNINILSLVTVEAAAHAQWIARAIPLTRSAILTQSYHFLLFVDCAKCSFSALPVLHDDFQESGSHL
jgi:hypothetical protein